MKEICNCIGGCAKPILNKQVMKCQDDVMKRDIRDYSNQREMLLGFYDWYMGENPRLQKVKEQVVDEFLEQAQEKGEERGEEK